MAGCLDNVNNYANLLNGVNLKNALTCSFTWLYLESEDKVIFGDQSTVPDGDSITLIEIEITDGTTTVNTSGAATPLEIDVSTLDNSLDWRINYSVTTAAACECTVSLFIAPYIPEVITGTSDPNELPLPITTLIPSVVVPSCVQCYEQSFTALTTWTVNHGSGFEDPLSIQTYNSSGQIIMVGRSNILPTSFDIVFGSPYTGSVKVLSKV